MADELGIQIGGNIGQHDNNGIAGMNRNRNKKDDGDKYKITGDQDNTNNRRDSIASSRRGSQARKQGEQKEYPFHQIPPDPILYEKHAKAMRVFAALPEREKNKTFEVCECCGNPVNLDQIRVCSDLSELYHLGAGYALYYLFVKFAFVFLTITFCISGIYNLYTNVEGEDCEGSDFGLQRGQSGHCIGIWYNLYSIANSRNTKEKLQIHNHLNIVTIVFMLIMIYIHRKRTNETADEIDISQQTPADYTIQVENCPLDATDDELINYFENVLLKDRKSGGKAPKVEKVCRTYNISKFTELSRQRTKLQIELAAANIEDKAIKEVELKNIEKEIEQMEDDTSGRILELTRYAFVTLNTEEFARLAIYRLKMGVVKRVLTRFKCDFCFRNQPFKGRQLIAKRPSEPNDVHFENLGYSNRVKFFRRMVSLFVSLILIAGSLGAIVAISYWKESINADDAGEGTTTILSLALVFVISFINSLAAFLTRKFSAYEKHSTHTNYFIGVAKRLAFVQFFNTGVVALLVAFILGIFFDQGGFMEDLFFIFAINVYIGPAFNFFNPWHVKRWCDRRKIRKQGLSCKMTQIMANRVFEGPPVDMAQRYANILKTLLLACMYSTAFPLGYPISIAGLFLAYWTDKYMLLRRHAMPPTLGDDLAFAMNDTLELVPVFYAIGNVIFMYVIVPQQVPEWMADVRLEAWIGLIIATFAYLFPCQSFVKCCHKREDRSSVSKSYIEVRKFFNNDYDIANPVTRNQALLDWLEFLKENDKEQYNDAKDIIKQEVGNDTQKEQEGKGTKNVLNNIINYGRMNPGLSQQYAQRMGGMGPVQPMRPNNQGMMLYNVHNQQRPGGGPMYLTMNPNQQRFMGINQYSPPKRAPYQPQQQNFFVPQQQSQFRPMQNPPVINTNLPVPNQVGMPQHSPQQQYQPHPGPQNYQGPKDIYGRPLSGHPPQRPYNPQYPNQPQGNIMMTSPGNLPYSPQQQVQLPNSNINHDSNKPYFVSPNKPQNQHVNLHFENDGREGHNQHHMPDQA